MRRYALRILAVTIALMSIAAPAWADVVSSPITPALTEVFPVLVVGCLGLFAIAAVIVGVVVIIRHNNKKKKAGDQ
ncbi:MAG: hypothetical protein FWF45_04805 [Coriobacteriia bacterium]|nr:hypothetical protein [Coriobacteriia bacterium]